jgi:hypothetical protein
MPRPTNNLAAAPNLIITMNSNGADAAFTREEEGSRRAAGDDHGAAGRQPADQCSASPRAVQ